MDASGIFSGHTVASLRVRAGVRSVSVMVALSGLSREKVTAIEAGDEGVDVADLRRYGDAIGADVATMVAAQELSRTVKTRKAPKGKKRAT